MAISEILGTTTMILGLFVLCVGLPMQIIKHHREKKCDFSPMFTLSILAMYISRASYAAAIGSWYIFIPDALGIILSVIVTFQAHYYRIPKKTGG